MTRKRLWRRSARGFVVAATKNKRLHLAESSRGAAVPGVRRILRVSRPEEAVATNEEVSLELPRNSEASCRAAAAKVKAGLRTVMTPEQRREFLMNSEYGRLTGVSKFFSKNED